MDPSKQFPKLGNITTQFGEPTQQEQSHGGIDIANKKGTPIPAFVPGKVIEVVTGEPHGANNYGNSVVVQSPNGDISRYSHLHDVLVKPGQTVGNGHEVGTLGDSGATYSENGGPSDNLDFRIKNAYGQYVDPTRLVAPYL